MGNKPKNDNKEQEEKDLKEHLRILGFSSSAAYSAWCSDNGLSTSLIKSFPVRRKEIQLLKDLQSKAALMRGREKHRPLSQKIEELLESNKFQSEDSQLKELLSIAGQNNEEKKQCLNFLWFLSKESKLLTDSEITKKLIDVFSLKNEWLREPETWKITTKNLQRQFSSLVRHLFSKYKLPDFFDNVWDRDTGDIPYKTKMEWFLWVAKGNNIRKAPNLPINLTKNMAHHFLQSPAHYSFFKALRYGQIRGMGGDLRLVQMVNETFLGRGFVNEEFWDSVILFFIQNPMLDRNQVGPIIDYLHNQKYSARAPQPGLTMKGRNPVTLLEQVEAWHKNLRKTQGKQYKEWDSCGFSEFSKEEKSGNELRQWAVVEMKNSKELDADSKVLRHCVSSYATSCVNKRCSIFSIRVNGERVATIEVIPQNKTVVQARGKFNALVDGKAWQILEEWSAKAGLKIQCSRG